MSGGPGVVDVVDEAGKWMSQDPDEATRAELRTLVEDAASTDHEAAATALAALHDRFDARLQFGTAGLRGEIAAGPNRMNRVVVGQAAAGIAGYLTNRAVDGERPSVVIGYDGRTNSSVFARDSAEIMAAAGLRVILLPRLLPTPLVAFAVRHLDVSAGIMVTASHNPPNDNGYKVYLGGDDEGSQIVSPADEQIEEYILRVASDQRVNELPRSDDYEIAPESVIDAYVLATASAGLLPADEIGAQPRTVYTAMHGVGWQTFSRVLGAAGFIEPDVVLKQIEPDARFPTVSFPNPEEPGALDLSFETARSSGAQLVIANDPDADRLAIAIPDASVAGGFRRLSGNEVGLLLGWRAAETTARLRAEGRDVSGATMACSVVSTPGLGVVAAAYGLRFCETLTGFKWVSRVPGLVFGFEEALGYLVNPQTIRDKDGISAAVALLSLASELAVDGFTLADQLDRFSERFGHFGSSQVSVRVTDLALIGEVMARLRSTPPRSIGGIEVEGIDDLTAGSPELPPSDILRIRLQDGSRIMVRPSGTEPKLKVYIDVSSARGSLAKRKAAVASTLSALEAGMRGLVS